MSIQYHYGPIHDKHRLPRRVTLLRLLGQALVGLADRRDATYEQRRHRSRRTPVPLSPYLRRDLGLPPEPDAPNHWELE